MIRVSVPSSGSGWLHLDDDSGARLLYNTTLSTSRGVYEDTKPLSESHLMPAGIMIRVRFEDREEIDGYSYGLRPLEAGFYHFPINRNNRNERIYLIKKNAIQVCSEEK
jgi:hypothetical protein